MAVHSCVTPYCPICPSQPVGHFCIGPGCSICNPPRTWTSTSSTFWFGHSDHDTWAEAMAAAKAIKDQRVRVRKVGGRWRCESRPQYYLTNPSTAWQPQLLAVN